MLFKQLVSFLVILSFVQVSYAVPKSGATSKAQVTQNGRDIQIQMAGVGAPINLNPGVQERIWSGFRQEFIQMYGVQLWNTLFQDTLTVTGGAAMFIGYKAIQKTQYGKIANLVLISLLLLWVGGNAVQLLYLSSHQQYENMGRLFARELNSLVMGTAGAGMGVYTMKKFPGLTFLIENIRSALPPQRILIHNQKLAPAIRDAVIENTNLPGIDTNKVQAIMEPNGKILAFGRMGVQREKYQGLLNAKLAYEIDIIFENDGKLVNSVWVDFGINNPKLTSGTQDVIQTAHSLVAQLNAVLDH